MMTGSSPMTKRKPPAYWTTAGRGHGQYLYSQPTTDFIGICCSTFHSPNVSRTLQQGLPYAEVFGQTWGLVSPQNVISAVMLWNIHIVSNKQPSNNLDDEHHFFEGKVHLPTKKTHVTLDMLGKNEVRRIIKIWNLLTPPKIKFTLICAFLSALQDLGILHQTVHVWLASFQPGILFAKTYDHIDTHLSSSIRCSSHNCGEFSRKCGDLPAMLKRLKYHL